jgi:Tfp pilus assembly protein PilF
MSDKTRKEMLEAMLAEEGSDPFLHYGLAMEYVAAGDDAGAVLRFEQLFVVAPEYVPAYLQAGQALVRLRRNEDARGVFERGIATAKRLGDAHAAEEMQGMLMNLTP